MSFKAFRTGIFSGRGAENEIGPTKSSTGCHAGAGKDVEGKTIDESAV
jgi:hypothetical protein